MPDDSHELLVRYQRGDKTAANAIFEKYTSRLLSLARSRLPEKLARRIDPDDIVQSTYRSFFVRAGAGDFATEREGDLWRLLATITLRKVGRQAQRHRAAKRSVLRETTEPPSATDWLAHLAVDRDPSPVDVIATIEELHWLLSQFDPVQRQALQLRLQEASEAEIAIAVGRSERTVRRWLVEARKLLAIRIAEQQQAEDRNPPMDANARLWHAATAHVAPLRHADYQLTTLIGSGGVSKVYVATHKASGRKVAIKVLRKRLRTRTHLVERFLKEAEIVGRFDHPNIVPIHGLGQMPDGGYFLVMDWVDGQNLSSVCASQPLPSRRAAEIVAVVADAVQHAHERGVIHRDLKPGNVLLSHDGRVFVTDFGFAWFDGELDRHDTSIVGTVGFMAPEQIDRSLGPTGPHTDVYGLGALLLMLCSGRSTFADVSESTLLHPVTGPGPQPTTSAFTNSILESFRIICQRCLASDWRMRYSSAAEVATALRS